MKAFLLVAGLGTRLRPLTEKIPKCLLPISGKPFLQLWLERLALAGVTEVLINTHWLHEQVEQFLHQWGDCPVKVIIFHEQTLLGSGGTLWANREWLDDKEPFYIIYGDNLTDVDLREMGSFHISHGLPFTLGVFHAEHPERCGIAEVDEQGLVTGFVEKPEEPCSDLAAAGMYMADSRIFAYFPEQLAIGTPFDLGFHVLPKLIGSMKVFPINRVIDIGTPASYELAREAARELHWA
jgi:mannose-1-phosphate guanylyltransferase